MAIIHSKRCEISKTRIYVLSRTQHNVWPYFLRKHVESNENITHVLSCSRYAVNRHVHIRTFTPYHTVRITCFRFERWPLHGAVAMRHILLWSTETRFRMKNSTKFRNSLYTKYRIRSCRSRPRSAVSRVLCMKIGASALPEKSLKGKKKINATLAKSLRSSLRSEFKKWINKYLTR